MTITWDSQFDLHSTYGIISTRICEELLKLGVDVRILPWPESTFISPALQRIADKPPKGIRIRMSGIDSISNNDHYSFIPDYVPSFQSPIFDKDIAMLNGANKLIIPSQYQKAAFDSLSLKSCVVPRGSDFKPIRRKKNSLYTFLFIGYLSEYKGIHYLAEAFRKAFTSNDKVRLILKGNSMKTHSDQMTNNELKAIFGQSYQQVKVIRENWNCNELKKLYAKSNCFVSPHCTLGMFGTRVALDARKTGLPLIAPRLGDVQLWGDSRYLVDYKLRDDGIEPNIKEFALNMKKCYDNYEISFPLDSYSWTWTEAANKFLKILYEDFNLGR